MRNRDLLARRAELVEKLVQAAVDSLVVGVLYPSDLDALRAEFTKLLASRWQT